MSPEPDKLRLSVVTEEAPARPRRILVVAAEGAVIRALREAFDPDSTVSLQITSDTQTATRMLAAHPVDFLALDPAVASGGFALLKHVEDQYRWTDTLVATYNQEHILTLSRGAPGGDLNIRAVEAHMPLPSSTRGSRWRICATWTSRMARRRFRSSRPRFVTYIPHMSIRIDVPRLSS